MSSPERRLTRTPTLILGVERELWVEGAEALERVEDEGVGVVEEVLR